MFLAQKRPFQAGLKCRIVEYAFVRIKISSYFGHHDNKRELINSRRICSTRRLIDTRTTCTHLRNKSACRQTNRDIGDIKLTRECPSLGVVRFIFNRFPWSTTSSRFKFCERFYSIHWIRSIFYALIAI